MAAIWIAQAIGGYPASLMAEQRAATYILTLVVRKAFIIGFPQKQELRWVIRGDRYKNAKSSSIYIDLYFYFFMCP